MKINKKELLGKKASMSYAQILILIISTFAIAYLIYKTTEVSAEDPINFTELQEGSYSNILGVYSQTQSITVQNLSGSIGGYFCCEKTNSGNICQLVPGGQCNSSFQKAQTECKYTNFCKLGCCYSSSTGWCNENTPQRSCEESSGAWKGDASCNIPECQRGCCVLGRNVLFTTQRNCQVEAGFLGIEKDFRSEIKSEIECIFLAEKEDEGACVFEQDFIKTCKFTTKESCSRMNGNFYKNIYCSDSALATDCKAHDHAACSKNVNNDGQSVYWFDSCGNKEEVKEECSIFLGTICGQVSGGYGCKSIDCNVDGKIRKNGESWCEYDGTIGNGRDVVGSRHIKHICFMGEERIEPCEDYRNQICVQSDTSLGNGKTFSEAACRINNWRSCMDYNLDEKSSAEKCNNNPDCFVKNINAADKFSFNFCVPNYPPGFDLTTEEGGRNAEMICGIASQKCTVIYVKKLSGWKCQVNCACEKAGFAQQMNEFCTSLGDCGAYVNTAGEVTDEGYSVSRSPRLSSSYLDSLKKYALPNPSQNPAEPGNLSFLGSLGAPGSPSYSSDNPGLKMAMGAMGVGFALQVASVMIAEGMGIGAAIGYTVNEIASAGAVGGSPVSLGAFGNYLAAAGSALAAAHIMSVAFGIDYTSALILVAVAIAVAIVAFNVAISTIITFLWKIFPYLIVLEIIILILGIGKTKKKIVTFKCLPWQPPSGGANCGKCNSNDPLGVPCSKYRCKSLGQTCEIVNEGTGQEACVDNNPNDVSSPRISPLFGIITEGYQYSNIKDTGFEVLDLQENCIPEFTNVVFGIKTDKLSQCKIGTDAMQTYDEMEFFGNSNLYLNNHTTILNMPSPSAFANQYNLTRAQIKALGEINYYVRCKSVNGKVNDASYIIRSCVKPGPDRTAPYITKTLPVNGAFVKYDATEQDLTVWTNEPANCKWSADQSKDYPTMENLMSCYTDLEDYSLYGWSCNSTLTELDKNTKFYIKCQDISENNNTMRQSYVYELSRSASELSIDEISPLGEIVAGVEPVTVNLEAKTSGGAENGKSICEFSFDGNSYITFLETGSDYHKQVFSQITRGSYKIYVKCEDIASNTAENFTEFNVDIDTEAPAITRAYFDGSLKISTNENAICGYSLDNCGFKIENSTLMSGEEKEHSADWQTDESYYIKCQDSYGNKPGGCSIVVRAYDIV